MTIAWSKTPTENGCSCLDEDSTSLLDLFELERTHPGACYIFDAKQLRGGPGLATLKQGVAVYLNEKYQLNARSCEDVYMKTNLPPKPFIDNGTRLFYMEERNGIANVKKL